MRFSAFVKGWIARTLPELMPQGSLQRADDIDFTVEGGLRCCRGLAEISPVPTGLSGSRVIMEYFSAVSGTATRHYFIKGGKLHAQVTGTGKSYPLQVMSGNSWAHHTVMTPTPSNFAYSYIATPAGLIRDTGNSAPDGSRFYSGNSWLEVGLPEPSGASVNNTGESIGPCKPGDEYKLAFTWYYSLTGAESYPSGTSTVVNEDYPWSPTVRIPADGRHGGSGGYADQFKIYCSIADGGTLRYHSTQDYSGTTINYRLPTLVNTVNVMEDDGSADLTADWVLDSGASMSHTGVSYRVGADTTGKRIYRTVSLVSDTVYRIRITIKNDEGSGESVRLFMTGATSDEWDGSGVTSKILTTTATATGHTFTARAAYADSAAKVGFVTQGTMAHDQDLQISNFDIYAVRSIDSDLGAILEDTGRPEPSSTLLATWRNRLWVSGADNISEGTDNGEDVRGRLYFSKKGYPETVPITNYISIGQSEAKIKALVVMGDTLYALTRRTIYEISGTTRDSFDFESTLAHTGTVATKSVAVGPEGVFFVSYDGVYLFKTKTKRISETIGWKFFHSNNTWNTVLTRSQLESARGVYWNNEYYVIVGGDTYIFTPSTKRWRRRSAQFDCIWVDEIKNKLWAGRRSVSSGVTSVVELVTGTSSLITGAATPDFVTNEAYIKMGEDKIPRTGYVRQFRVHALGYWTFYFYLDGTLQHTQTGTSYTAASRSIIYSLPESLKGTGLYVRGVAGASITPRTTRFYSMDIE